MGWRGQARRQEQRSGGVRRGSVGGADFVTRQVGRGEVQALGSLLGHSGAAFHCSGAMQKQGLEPSGHGWGLGGGQVQQVADENGFQQAEHHHR